jgi:hypothetical protein
VKTGEVLFSSSRSLRGDIETLLEGIIPQAAADLTGRSSNTSTDTDSPRVQQIERKPYSSRSTLPEGTARVTESGYRKLDLELGRDPKSNLYDRYESLDSAGQNPSWVRLSSRPEEPRTSGGSGEALVMAGDFDPGQPLRKIPQLPLVFEFHAGHGFENPDNDTITNGYDGDYSVYHPVADLYAMCWFRVGGAIESWIGIGLELNILNRETFQRSYSWNSPAVVTHYNSKNTYNPGVEIAWHKGFPIVRRFGVFWQIGGSIHPGSDIVTAFTPLVGVSWELAPDLSLHGSGGFNMTVISTSNSTPANTANYEGVLLNPTCGLSLAWTPRLSH